MNNILNDFDNLVDNEKIFINIASYRDPTLVNTLKSALKNADKPEKIVFGIALQYFENEIPDLSFIPYNQVKIISYNPNERPGVTRIRYEISKLVTDEYWYLLIDSHTCFEKGWDSILKSQMNNFKDPVVFTNKFYNREKDVVDNVKINLDHALDIIVYSVKPNSAYSFSYGNKFYEFHETNWIGCYSFFARRDWLSNVGHDSITEHFGYEEIYLSWKTLMNGYKILSMQDIPLYSNPKEYLKYVWNIDEKDFRAGNQAYQDFGELGNSKMRWRRVNPEIDKLDEISWCLQILAIAFNLGPYRVDGVIDFKLLKEKFL